MGQNNRNNLAMNQAPASRYRPKDEVPSLPMLGFWEAVKTCFRKFFVFKGRARRSELWWFVLFSVLLGVACSLLDNALSSVYGIEFAKPLASLLLFIPGVAVIFRRLHDVGHSGWWAGAFYLLLFGDRIVSSFVDWDGVDAYATSPGVGEVIAIGRLLSAVLSLAILAFALYDSDVEENKYGPSPKYL